MQRAVQTTDFRLLMRIDINNVKVFFPLSYNMVKLAPLADRAMPSCFIRGTARACA
jgi:hypothetical protein